MNTNFFLTSKKLADDFLQNIVFIDDKAFNSSEQQTNHDFDAYSITHTFAQKNKICAIYKPKSSADVHNLSKLAKKADITVLDWQINLEDENIPQGTEEDDAIDEDPRGPHTLKIIHEIVSHNNNDKGSLKLIIVYTGEIGLTDIRDDIFNSLKDKGIEALKGDFEISTGNVKVSIIAKADNEQNTDGSIKSKFNHNPEFNARVKTYKELPDFILDEFTKMTSGLLSNFVLKSLTILRNNTFKLIQLYNKELDLSFLTHYLLLPHQEGTKEHMIDIFSDSVQALLHYNDTADILSKRDIQNWIDTVDAGTFNKKIQINGKSVSIDSTFLKTWIEAGFIGAIGDQWGTKITEADETSIRKKKEAWAKSVSPLIDGEKINQQDIEFSVLTHHKSIFKPTAHAPKLTLGAVIKGERSGYWVCIQQRCDSVRLAGETRFLFLPLKDVTSESQPGGFNFVTADGKRLKLSKKSFDLRTIKFVASEGEDFIRATANEGRFFFAPVYKNGHPSYSQDKDEEYEWILDLKDLHAQRIATDFAHELSRVGLDESEWLRRRS